MMSQFLLSCLLFISVVLAQPRTCKRDNVYQALLRASDEASFFCPEFIAQTSFIGTLRGPITIPVTKTVTDPRSTDPVMVFKSQGTSTDVITTSYASQTGRMPNPTAFTIPLPSYIQQFASSQVSSACSCIVTSVRTDTIYRPCEPKTYSTSYTTLTFTTGKPGKQTITYTYTDTSTIYESTTAPFPTACPEANDVDYVGSDLSTWERGCDTALNCVRPLKSTTAADFDACIEQCVAYNKKLGHNQCQAVLFYPSNGNTCELGK